MQQCACDRVSRTRLALLWANDAQTSHTFQWLAERDMDGRLAGFSVPFERHDDVARLWRGIERPF